MKPAEAEMRMMFQMESTNQNAADVVSLFGDIAANV